MIEILETPPLATVQDHGRSGARKYGVGVSGAMDDLALKCLNLMLGNAFDAAAIELPIVPFRVRFLRDTRFALAGAEGVATLDGAHLPVWWCGLARAGQTLAIERLQSGARCYLGLEGGMDVPSVLGSRSTQLRGEFGGLDGRYLRKGDRLAGRVSTPSHAQAFGIVPPWENDAFADEITWQRDQVRLLPAAEYELFDAQSLATFWQSEWQVSAQSDRYGYRLKGPQVTLSEPVEMRSHGIVPGVMQVPPNGQPIIQMRDAQPSGGYPKLGTVIQADLWKLAQTAAGKRVRFVQASYATAVEAAREHERYLETLQRDLAIYLGFTARSAHG